MSELPTIRIEVEGMRHALVRALEASNRDIQAMVSEKLAELDVEAVIAHQVERLLPGVLEECVRKAMTEDIEQAVTAHVAQLLPKAKPQQLGVYRG